jgi:hypothetical protein
VYFPAFFYFSTFDVFMFKFSSFYFPRSLAKNRINQKKCIHQKTEINLHLSEKCKNPPGWGFTKLLRQIHKIFCNFGP